MLQIGPSKALHINQHRLAKMPTQKLIGRSKWIVEEGLVKVTTCNITPGGLGCETYNLYLSYVNICNENLTI